MHMHKLILTKERYNAFFCVLYFFISDLSRMLALVGVPRAASYVAFLFCFFLYFLSAAKAFTVQDLLIEGTIIIISIFGLISNSQYIANDTNLFVIIIVFIPAYYFFSTATEEALEKGLKYSSLLSGVYLIAYYLLMVRRSTLYDMSYSGWVSVPASVLFYYFIEEKKKIYLPIAIFLFITAFVSGSRSGPLLTLLCCMYFLLIRMKDSRMGKALVIAIGALLIAARVNLNWILERLGTLSGMSRNIRKLLSGDMLVSRPREALYIRVRNLISAKPLGYGPLTSRRVLTGEPYPHSLFYEFQMDYGVYIGTILFIIIIAMAIYLLIKKRNSRTVPLIGVLCIIGLGTLMVSSSYFHGYTVPAIIALFVQEVKHKKNRTMDSF